MFTYPSAGGAYDHGRQGYAVVDLETTGFDAFGDDRILEIAIVRIDMHGRWLGEFSTLVHPRRAVAAGGVHRIDDAMVRDAPTFDEIAPAVLAWLQGTVVVAHNAQFEDAFLTAELTRNGWVMPPVPALDTLPLAQSWVPTRNHKLATVCAWAGVEIDGPHTALGDARATACMLPALLCAAGPPLRWTEALPPLGGYLAGRYLPRSVLAAV